SNVNSFFKKRTKSQSFGKGSVYGTVVDHFQSRVETSLNATMNFEVAGWRGTEGIANVVEDIFRHTGWITFDFGTSAKESTPGRVKPVAVVHFHLFFSILIGLNQNVFIFFV